MVSDFNEDVVKQIRQLYKSDPAAQKLFDLNAGRDRDATSTSIDRISSQINVSRGEAVALARRLEDAKCGEFVVGRHGQKSRFRWAYSCISLGQAAAGESSVIEKPENPVAENEEDAPENPIAETPPIQSPLKLTIAEAKAALANSLGVPLANIEIIVKG